MHSINNLAREIIRCVDPSRCGLDRDINDTFKSEQGLQSLAFFLIALAVGFFFLYPLLYVSPTLEVDQRAPRPTRRGDPAVAFPAIQSTWPTLGRLRHPAVFFLGLSGKSKEAEASSAAESEEFERILNSEDSSDDEDRNIRLRRLFGKPRRFPQSNV